MQYDQFFSGEYQIEQVIDRSQYSVLCVGKKSIGGQQVLIRLWLTAQPNAEEQERVREEVAALQGVEHPYLLPILAVEADTQKVFLVSAYTTADSLNTLLAQDTREAFSLDKTLQIIDQAGQALQALHEQNIVHGNLTPQAVFFTNAGNVQLGEYLLRSVLVSIQDYQHILDENVPRCLYMAPEQFRGTLDAKTDQYALGCLAYLLLTGRVPFAGSARATLLQKHQRDTPQALSVLNPAVPEHIEAAILKALSKEPEERHSSVQAFLEKLDIPGHKVLADQATLKHPAPTTEASEATAADPTLWEWEVSLPPEGPLQDAGPGPLGSKPRVTPSPPVARSTGKLSSGRSVTPQSSSSRKREIYVIVPLVLVVLLLVFATGRWLFATGGPVQQPTTNVSATPTSVLLTPVEATVEPGATPTVPSTVVSMQFPTPTPTPKPVPTPTPKPQPTPTPTPAALLTVAPFLDCVVNMGRGNYLAKFGYQNYNSSAVTIPVGEDNSVYPGNLGVAPPTLFSPGIQHQVYQVHFYNFMFWTIKGHTASATSSSPRC